METVKDIKSGNGVLEKDTRVKEDTQKDLKGPVNINKITEEDLTNLKQIFTWALTVTVKDRSTLASIVTFENILFKKLEPLKK